MIAQTLRLTLVYTALYVNDKLCNWSAELLFTVTSWIENEIENCTLKLKLKIYIEIGNWTGYIKNRIDIEIMNNIEEWKDHRS